MRESVAVESRRVVVELVLSVSEAKGSGAIVIVERLANSTIIVIL